MSSAQEESSGVSRQAKNAERNRRSWTQNEEAALIGALKELIAQGQKSDNGFRAGYLIKLQDAIKKQFSNTDLRGTPHINSKLSTWKTYYALSGILSRSGIGFNVRGNHKIDCKDDQWEQVVKMDPNARGMRYKSWPLYDDWKQIFGKDRANGETAEDIFDAWNSLRDEDNTTDGGNGGDYYVSLEDLPENEATDDSVSHTEKTRDVPIPKTKKRKVTDETSGIKEVLAEFEGKLTRDLRLWRKASDTKLGWEKQGRRQSNSLVKYQVCPSMIGLMYARFWVSSKTSWRSSWGCPSLRYHCLCSGFSAMGGTSNEALMIKKSISFGISSLRVFLCF